LLSLLKTHFGFDAFRPLQKEIIENVLAQKDSFVLMPTGGGKSLCYQLPALKLDGLTLVVSPLIALMKDQVDSLRANGIAAEFINSALSAEEISHLQNEAQAGKIKILYVAPERLALANFKSFLQTLKIKLIAIDEAHCISEWGHDFRPDYRNLKRLRVDFPHTPVIALTATATKKVKEDILNQLNLTQARIFISSFNRPNLTYVVQQKKQSFSALLNLLQKYKKSSVIIYCFSRKNTENLATDLKAEGFSALPYHAGLNNEVRKKTQEKFIRDEINIITATIAFGMGIDKPDVRLVVHFDMPKSIEGYYQETGRAGRDNLPSECVLFYSYGDKFKQDFFIRQIKDSAERKNAEIKLDEIIKFCELSTCRRKYLLEYFGEKYLTNCNNCDTCLTPQDEFDATEITQKVLSCIIRTGERFGSNYIMEVLRGSKSAKVLERKHNQLPVYGIVKDFGEEELKKIINLLLQKNLLEKNEGEYPTLRVSASGRELLQQRGKIFLPKPRIKIEISATKTSEDLDFDQDLFIKLRSLRKTIADEKNVPPFVIFGDVTLREMAYYFPQNKEGFARMTGVGEVKLKDFSDAFLKIIVQHVKQNNLKPREIPLRRISNVPRSVKRAGSTYDETKKLFLQKLKLAEIAKKRGFSLGTVIAHLEKLISAGENFDLTYLKPPQERFNKIKTAFQQSGGENLTPVREILGEEFSYDELRLARIFLKK